LISVPVWGERCVDVFCAAGLPALQRAVAALEATHGVDARLVVHTDQPDKVRGATSLKVECRPVPVGLRDFDSMSQGHREVMAMGLRWDVVVPLTADTVISEQGLSYCARVLEDLQLRAVLVAVPRTLQQGRVPDTADAAGLMAWSWANRHPAVAEATWPEGRSRDLSRTFFEAEGTVVTRQALPHPLAIRVDGRPLRFTPTVDANLIQCFDPTEMHMTPNCRELALIEMSPPDKPFDVVEGTMARRLASGALVIPDPVQRWCLNHKVTLVGTPRDCADDAFVGQILGQG
jgi:hypothetical protein